MASTNCKELRTPSAHEYFKALDEGSRGLIIAASVLTVISVALFGLNLFSIWKWIDSNSRKFKLTNIAGLFPVTTINCIISICVPKSTPVCDTFITLYYISALISFVTLIINLFDGRKEMANQMTERSISLAAPPLFCCCRCLPKIQASRRNLRSIEILVYQSAVVKIATNYMYSVIWADASGNLKADESPAQFFTAINTISTLIAIYGTVLYTRMAAEPLKGYQVRFMFVTLQLTYLFFNIQGTIFNMLATSAKVIHCDFLLPAAARAHFWHHLLLILESVLIGVAATLILRPKTNLIFDRIHQEDKNVNGDVALS